MLPNRPSSPRGLLWRLPDGKALYLRPAGPQDRERIRRGLGEMSHRSRYLRFFAGTSDLSDAQLRDLTEVDQIDHVAWCALDPDEEGMPGRGIARYRRLRDDASTAEWAVAIVDAYQRRGLGRALTALLCALAHQGGVRTLRCRMLEENLPVVQWLIRLGGVARRGDGAYEIDLQVEELVKAPRQNESAFSFDVVLRELLRQING